MLKKPYPRMKPDPIPTPEKIKIAVVGDKGVGKTQMLSSYCNGKYSEEYDPTIGSDFFIYNGKFGSGVSAKQCQL